MTTNVNDSNVSISIIIDHAVRQASQCNKAGAFKSLITSCHLTPEQTTKIKSILDAFQPNVSMTGCIGLKREISAVMISGTLEAISQSPKKSCASLRPNAQGFSQNQDVFVSFFNNLTSAFANDFPCRFEFGGKYYPNATVCILAQQYTDQPDMADLLIGCETTEEALTLAELTPMTTERSEHINQLNVMMHVLREKFEQNPELINQLVATGNAFLVCQGHDLFLSDHFNGNGKNILGICLMQLRGEYGDIGVVHPCSNYLSSIESLSHRCHFVTNALFSDDIHQISLQCLSTKNWDSLSALACLNTHWNACSKTFWDKLDLKQLCPPELNILDAKMQGVEIDDEPSINILETLKAFKKLAPFVDENAGLTLLTMTRGLTLNQLVKIAMQKGMVIEFPGGKLLQNLGDIPVEQTYRILITNSVFINSRYMSYDVQKDLVSTHGCEMPTLQEYVALCVLTNTHFSQCLYGKNPYTYGRSSTHHENRFLTVGGCALFTLYVDNDRLNSLSHGAGGKRKF